MKVAFIVNDFPKLSETFILSQIVGLKEAGVSVDIYPNNKTTTNKLHSNIIKYNLLSCCYYLDVPKSKLAKIYKGIKFSIINFRYIPSLLKSLNFMKYGKDALNLNLLYHSIRLISSDSNNYDIVLCHFGMNGKLAIRLREIGVLKGKIVTAFHGYDLTKFLNDQSNNYYNDLFQKGDLFLPISNNWRKKLIDLGCPVDKIRIHRMGVDIEKFKFQPLDSVKGENVSIVSIARLVEKKGIEYGVKAVLKTLDKNPNIEYKIIGDGPLKDSITKIINDSDFKDKIKLLGWMDQEEIIDVLENCDLFLAPSVTAIDGDQEGIPVVLMEALARGIPVISTYHSGIPELIINNKSGYLVQEKNVDILAESITKCLESSNVELEEIVKYGRVIVEGNYNNKKLNVELIKLFVKLIENQQKLNSI